MTPQGPDPLDAMLDSIAVPKSTAPSVIDPLDAMLSSMTPLSAPKPDFAAVSRSMELNPPGIPKPGLPPQSSIFDSLPNRAVPVLPPQIPVAPMGPGSYVPVPSAKANDSWHPIEAAQQLGGGVKEFVENMPVPAGSDPMTPNSGVNVNPRKAAHGATDALKGGMTLAAPLVGVSFAAAPLHTFLTLAGGTIADLGVNAGLKKLGVADEYADLGGTVAGLLSGYGTGKIRFGKEQKSLVDVLRGKDIPLNEENEVLHNLMNLADRATTAGERNAAVAAIKRKFGMDYDAKPFTESEPATETAATPPQTPVRDWTDPSGIHTETAARPPQAPPSEPSAAPAPQTPQTVPNLKAFTKAHDLWNKQRNDAAVQFMEENPGVGWDDARAATETSAGPEPHPNNFQMPAPPPPPAPAPEPVPPTVVDQVSDKTPNPPTAYAATTPESPETIAIQVGQLNEGTRRAVMFPKGQGQPMQLPSGVAITSDGLGNTYAYRPDLIKETEIKKAAKNNTLTQVLGGSEGMGAPDKSALQGETVTVVARDPTGNEVQATVTDEANIQQTIAATQALVPAGGSLTVEPPAAVVAGRPGGEGVAGLAHPTASTPETKGPSANLPPGDDAFIDEYGNRLRERMIADARKEGRTDGIASAERFQPNRERVQATINNIREKNADALHQTMGLQNPTSRWLFEAVTGIKLPKTERDTTAVLRDYVGHEKFDNRPSVLKRRAEEAAEAATKAAKPPAKSLQETKADQYLEGKIRTEDFGVVTRRERILKRMAAGSRPELRQVEDEATRKRLKAEFDQMNRGFNVPWGNASHPKTIEAQALKDRLAGKITKNEYLLAHPDGRTYTPLAKTEYDFAMKQTPSEEASAAPAELSAADVDVEPSVPESAPSPAETTTSTPELTPKQKRGQEYVDRLLNPPKKQYAQEYFDYLTGKTEAEPLPRKLNDAGAADVRSKLGRILGARVAKPAQAAQPHQPEKIIGKPAASSQPKPTVAADQMEARGSGHAATVAEKATQVEKKPVTPQIQTGVAGATPLGTKPDFAGTVQLPATGTIQTPQANPQGLRMDDSALENDLRSLLGNEAVDGALGEPTTQPPAPNVTAFLEGGRDAKLPSPPKSTPIKEIEAEAFPPTVEDAPKDEPGHIKLANAALRVLQDGGSFGNNVKFQEIADAAFGGSRASGKYDMKQAYDALEAAVNRYVADSIGTNLLSSDPKYALEQLRELMSRLPTQNIRTENQELLQQFSTPPTLSYFASKVAAIRDTDVALEPSAGTGSLASWAKAAGAIVRTNEIDPRRAELLEYAVRDSAPTQHDAEFLNSTLPAEIQPTVVVMNPPFSATGGRLTANKNTFGYRHVMEALKRLQAGGRLVAILGEGATPTAPNAAGFWKDIAKYGILRANVGIDGREYAKYGTTFGNRLIVVDKVPAGSISAAAVTGEFSTIEEAYDAVRSIIEDRPVINRPAIDSRPASAPVVRTGGPVRGATGAESGVSPERGGGSGAPVAGNADAKVPQDGRGGGAETVRGQKPAAQVEIVGPAEISAGPVGDSGGSAVEPLRLDDRVSLEARKKEDLLARTEDDSSFVEYVPSIEGLAHPGRLVETKVMASVNPPPVTYTPNLPSNVKAPKPLSAAQMETVARAGQMHSQFTESGQRIGFLLGDGTGVGKGQQIAAIIWDRNRSGQKRALWVSASKGLQKDAKRDFMGIGANALSEKLFSVNDWNAAQDIDLKEGVIFSTYQSLVAKAKGEKGQTRLDQLKKWLGPEGVIIFDEAQKGKNAVAGTGRAVSSKTGENVVKMQDELPKSYIVYASATAATDVNNLGYMTRMDLWGKGTPFHQGFGHFMTEVGRGGIAAMELIAREMKATGKYLSRFISYKGVTFEEAIHDLTPEQRQTYDTAVKGWQQVLSASMEQIKDNNADGSRALGEFTQAYWGTHQRFFRKLLTAMKVPTVMRLVDEAIADGKAVVISLIGTGQAQADQAMASGAAEDEDDLDFSPKDSLIQMVRESYPTVMFEEYETEDGSIRKRPVVRDGKIVENPEAVAKRDDLIEQLDRDLALPDNPLDFIIRSYGRGKVSELTGRKKSVERNAKSGKWENVSRAPEGVPMEKINEYEMEQFQSGQKDIAIISKASGAGFSLHADLAAKNQKPRLHIVMELSWSADDQMQSFGRTHRSNQKQPPTFVIISTDAGGEKRFSSTIARRLESLGALTKGQRDASGGGSVLAKYNFETQQGEQAAQAFYQYLLEQNPTIEGTNYTGHEILKQMGILKQRTDDNGEPVGEPTIERENLTNVTRLMNRVMNVELGTKPMNHQNAVFDLFTNLFDQAVQRAIENGTLDTGVNLVRGDHVRLVSATPIAKDPASGAETFRYVVEAERKNKPVSVRVVKDLQDKGRGRMMKRREFKGATEPDQIIWVERSRTPITNKNGTVERAYNTFGPAHREAETAYGRISESDLNLTWESIEGDKAMAEVSRLDKSIKEYEGYVKEQNARKAAGQPTYGGDHYEKELKRLKAQRDELLNGMRKARETQFDLWQEAYDAAPKNRVERIDMIGGSVMRVWPLLKVGNGRMDIRIAYPDSGGSVTGVAMSEGDANAVEASLTGNKVIRGPSSVFDAALTGKEVFSLAGGVRLTMGRINRQPVVEVTTNDYNNQKFFDSVGVKKEKIGWQYKYYIPNDPSVGVPIVEKLLKQFPIEGEGRGQRSSPGVTFGMGLGAAQPYLEKAGEEAAQFTRQVVAPKLAKGWLRGRNGFVAFVHILAPRTGVQPKILDTIYRMKGGREAANFLLISQLDKWSKRVNGMTREQMVEFIDKMKTGGKQVDAAGDPDSELQELANYIRGVDDQLYEQIKKYRPSLDYLDNHFRVLWKVIPGSPEAKGETGFRGAGKRPLQGSKGFLKQSKLADMSEGLELGGVPYSYNPMKLFQAHYADSMKFITAQRLWEQFKKDGVRKFVPFGQSAPPGYKRLDDGIARVYFPVEQGMVTAGEWYVEDGAARLLNNMLSRDYLRNVYSDKEWSALTGNVGRFLLDVKNAYTAIELGMSPFHAVFESIEAMASMIGIGAREFYNLGIRGGDPKMLLKGAKTLATFPSSFVSMAKHGSMAKRVYSDFEEMSKTVAGRRWLDSNPGARENIPYFFIGGGKMGVPDEFRAAAMGALDETLANNSISKGWVALKKASDMLSKPLFDIYIPNLKLGFFLREFALARQEYADRLNSSEMSLDEVARRVVDSVENRFGEMNFDNLFWDNSFKTSLQILTRSVTWKLGNLRAQAGGIFGQGSEIVRALRHGGKESDNGVREPRFPLLHGNMAWMFGVVLTSVIMGTILNLLFRKKLPELPVDVMYPEIAPGFRVSMPTYARDAVHLQHDPLGYVTSSASGDIGKMIELWENKDFYGNEVYGEDDNPLDKTKDIVKHAFPKPFAVTSYMQARKQGASNLAKTAGFLGFTKAPAYATKTDAENLATEYLARHREVGSRTRMQADRAQARSAVRGILQAKGDPSARIREAEKEGLLNGRDVANIRKNLGQSSLRLMVKTLTMAEALKVYDIATPAEKKELQRDVRGKVFASRSKPVEWGKPRSFQRQLSQKHFGVKGPNPGGLGAVSPIQ